MTVSVVIITHNRIDCLIDAVNTARKQTLRPDEIVVVDDGSEFAVEEKLRPTVKKIGDISIKFVRLNDLGPSAARNAGAKASAGTILAFLDDDDLWHSSYLEKAIHFFEEASFECVITWMDNYHEGVISQGKHLPVCNDGIDLYYRNWGVTGSNIIIKKDSYQKIGGFDPKLLASEDKDFLIRLLANNVNLKVLTFPLVYHRIHSSSQLSANLSFNRFKISGKSRFLEKYADKMSNSTYTFLAGQLGYIYFFGCQGFRMKYKGVILMFCNRPGLLVETLRTLVSKWKIDHR